MKLISLAWLSIFTFYISVYGLFCDGGAINYSMLNHRFCHKHSIPAYSSTEFPNLHPPSSFWSVSSFFQDWLCTWYTWYPWHILSMPFSYYISILQLSSFVLFYHLTSNFLCYPFCTPKIHLSITFTTTYTFCIDSTRKSLKTLEKYLSVPIKCTLAHSHSSPSFFRRFIIFR